jgi:hypothetical protein
MKEYIEELYELCETVNKEIADANQKIRSSGGKLSAGDVDYLDKLTHMAKSLKTTIAMMESEEDEGNYSNHYWPMPYGRSYADDNGRGMSHARGRNTRRDSMGRYSRTGGYSYADGMESLLVEMREMMGDLPEEKRREVQRFVDKMERM